MIGFHVTTLGCKLNQFDTAEIAGALVPHTAPVADATSARLILVNTCTVTATADADARKLLRRRRRESPRALIVASGCYAEREPEALGTMPEVDLILRRGDRPRAAAIILEELRRRFPEDLSDGCAERRVEESLPDFGGRTRAYLRVQEGCDLRCTYCVIPTVRGDSRSVPPDIVGDRFDALRAAGYAEIVLTGVNTGDYGRDLPGNVDLPDLLDRLLDRPGEYRVRLNSVEPRRVTPRLVERLATRDRLARHLQVPLQSGSDSVLRGMHRNYRTRHYARILAGMRERMPDIGLGADVIVGFPGETDEDFERTMSFILSSPLNYLHVFSYSSRPGTPAADMPGQVPAAVIRDRSRALRAVGEDLATAFRRSQIGTVQRVVVMGPGRVGEPRRALTSNFIEVRLDEASATGAASGSFLDVRIVGLDVTGRALARRGQEDTGGTGPIGGQSCDDPRPQLRTTR